MKLSIFPQCKALPKSKEEKTKYAKFSSNPYMPEIVEVKTDDDLIDIVTTNSWSPFIFKGFRSQKNFLSTDFIVFDIDDGMKINEAESVVHELDITCLCLPSTSHTDENHRFRLVFPLVRPIKDVQTYEATVVKLGEYFPYDPSCLTDNARFYFGCKFDDGFWYESSLLEPSKPAKKRKSFNSYDSKQMRNKAIVLEENKDIVEQLYGEPRDRVPEQVAYFIQNAHTGLEGKWYNSANSFVFTLGLQEVPFENIHAVFEHIAPNPLDDRDELILEKAYQDAQLIREDDYVKKDIILHEKRTKRSRGRR